MILRVVLRLVKEGLMFLALVSVLFGWEFFQHSTLGRNHPRRDRTGRQPCLAILAQPDVSSLLHLRDVRTDVD